MEETKARGCLLGLAVADALGAPLEFSTPDAAKQGVERGLEMTGGGGWEPGEWTDDTAMAICLAECVIEHGLPLDLDELALQYGAWAASGPKDIGITTRAALTRVSSAADARENARQYHDATGRSAGNGTVMRASPIALASDDPDVRGEAARRDAELTHHDRAAGACSAALCQALRAVAAGRDPLKAAAGEAVGHPEVESAVRLVDERQPERIEEMAGGPLSGVAWSTLAVGIWAVSEHGYEGGVSWAISLGGDTDTNGAVAGALLGAREGVEAIPDRWLEPLRERERIDGLARELVGG